MTAEVAAVTFFVDRAFDGMTAIVSALGDADANVRPAPGANSPYVLLTHCLGVCEFWGGAAIAGRTISRDRPAEFVASGPVAPLLARTAGARQQLASDLRVYEADSPPRRAFENDSLPAPMTQRGCLLHLYEELAQHHGQMEILRDAIRARA